MATRADIFLGFDPGGASKFGVAILQNENVRASVCSGIREAVQWALKESQGARPVAAGIDTLLHWSTSPTGLREADRWLRAKYPDAKKSVVSPNALYGAMTIGGMGLALELRRVWPSIRLNETHPKMLYREISGARYVLTELCVAVQRFVRYSNLKCGDAIANDHEFDAVLSAWATRQGYANGWQDLAALEADSVFPAGEVNYLWPPPSIAE